MKNIESYCSECKNLTIWTPERMKVEGEWRVMYRCMNSTTFNNHYATREHLAKMQKEYDERVSRIAGEKR